jgi:hypothetical protein
MLFCCKQKEVHVNMHKCLEKIMNHVITQHANHMTERRVACNKFAIVSPITALFWRVGLQEATFRLCIWHWLTIIPGREADHSPPSSAEVKNAWSYASTPPYAFVGPIIWAHI